MRNNLNFCRLSYFDEKFKLNERNDCTVRALATALKVNYFTAHEGLKKDGRKPRKGIYFDDWMSKNMALPREKMNPLLRDYKITYYQYDPKGKGKNKMTPAKFAKLFYKGTYIVQIPHHVFALVDGVVYDAGRFRPGTRVYNAWKFEKIHPELTIEEISSRLEQIPVDSSELFGYKKVVRELADYWSVDGLIGNKSETISRLKGKK